MRYACLDAATAPSSRGPGTPRGRRLGSIQQGAVTECEQHGHYIDRADPDGWNRAREDAWRNPFPGATADACIAALENVMRGIGGTCPDCG